MRHGMAQDDARSLWLMCNGERFCHLGYTVVEHIRTPVSSSADRSKTCRIWFIPRFWCSREDDHNKAAFHRWNFAARLRIDPNEIHACAVEDPHGFDLRAIVNIG